MKGKTRTHIGLEICSIEQTTIHGTCYTIRRCFYLGEILVYRVLSKLSITVEIAKYPASNNMFIFTKESQQFVYYVDDQENSLKQWRSIERYDKQCFRRENNHSPVIY